MKIIIKNYKNYNEYLVSESIKHIADMHWNSKPFSIYETCLI